MLSAGTWGDAVDVGGTLQAGLLDALNSLVKDAYQEIELTDVHAFEAQGASRRIGGAAPVVMPRLDEDLIGSVLQEADVANFYSEFEAELNA